MTNETNSPAKMNRYSLGYFQGAPAMFKQPEGEYVKWSDIKNVRNLMAMSEAEIDAELVSLGIDPATAATKGAQAVADALAKAGCVCGLCGKDAPHQHTPAEVVIFRNGIKRGDRAAKEVAAQTDAREAAFERAANLVECEYAENATQDRRLKQIAQHIRDLKNRKPL